MKHPAPSFSGRRVTSGLLLFSFLAQSTGPAFAVSSGYTGQVAQLPGVYTAPPDVNVMFTLDDSGSMQSDVIPDITSTTGLPTNGGSRFLSNSKYANMWGPSTEYLAVAYYSADGVSNANMSGRYFRSPSGNPMYYNPETRYRPWPKADDNREVLANANPAAVIIDPETPTTTLDANERRILDLTQRIGSGNNRFWPATYFIYKGTQPMSGRLDTERNIGSNFTKYEITGSSTTGLQSFPKYPKRTDCNATECTREQELQNFANWLQYYRNRRLMAKGGVATAFAAQGTNLRVGYAMIGKGSNVIQRGVRQFIDDPVGTTNRRTLRTEFFNKLYGTASSDSTTPLRTASKRVGDHFETDEPWAENPASPGTGTERQCRRSFHFLSTDGYWNDSVDTNLDVYKNNDDLTGLSTPVPYRGTSTNYTINTGAPPASDTNRFTVHPFKDGHGSNLSDVAAYYWKRDLRPTVDNRVAPTSRDPAFWQHLSTYTIGLGISGTGEVKLADGTKTRGGIPLLASQDNIDWLIANRQQLVWPQTVSDSASTGDDLIHASMVGRGRYFSASDPSTLAAGLSTALAEATDQPLDVANVTTESGYVSAGGEVYQATFNPSGWTGRLYAFRQNTTGAVNNTPSTTGNLNPDQLWEASLVMPAPADRVIYTSSGNSGTARLFLWDNLTDPQKLALENNPDLLTYLRGDGTKELANPGGVFRDRPRYKLEGVTGGVLGDIVNGSPTKGPDGGGGYEALPPGAARNSYAEFRNGNVLNSMRNTLFASANDGMLHAFNTATGRERFAYVPNAVYTVKRSMNSSESENKLAMLSKLTYTHRYTVDGQPNIGDAYLQNGWRTVLVSSNGAGARGIFAIDVTNTETTGAGALGASNFLWEFTDDSPGGADMGFVLSYPHIARMRNGRWAAIFGNGYDSANGRAKLFIVDIADRSIIKTFTLGTGTNNGLSQPNFVLNSAREVIGIYAGDLKGNMWKFNVSDANPDNWRVAFNTTASDESPATVPLFRALNANGRYQPISVMPELVSGPNGQGVMVIFGTGKLFEDSDILSTAPANDTDASNNTGNRNLLRQSMYGIWDNGTYTDATNADGTVTSTVVNGDPVTMTADADATTGRAIILSGTTGATVPESTTVRLGSSAANAPDYARHRGWYIDLPGTGERVNLAAQQVQATLFMATNTPITGDPCANGGSSIVYALNALTGAAPAYPTFDTNNDGRITEGAGGDDASKNVLFGRAGTRSRSTFQLPAAVLAPDVGPDGPQSKTNQETTTAFYRGQPAGLQGGVTLDPKRDSDCVTRPEGNMLAGNQDTSIDTMVIGVGGLCPGGPRRITWRQLQ